MGCLSESITLWTDSKLTCMYRSTIPDGAYFILINTERLEIPADFKDPEIIAGRAADWRAAWFVAQTAKVVLIPVTDFYDKEHWSMGEKYIRM